MRASARHVRWGPARRRDEGDVPEGGEGADEDHEEGIDGEERGAGSGVGQRERKNAIGTCLELYEPLSFHRNFNPRAASTLRATRPKSLTRFAYGPN
ncbi:hypothetical protein KM043_002761 [Ampulex compressa]|nr:hypothetical protein KM043_002761 [Ampulex compressa]